MLCIAFNTNLVKSCPKSTCTSKSPVLDLIVFYGWSSIMVHGCIVVR